MAANDSDASDRDTSARESASVSTSSNQAAHWTREDFFRELSRASRRLNTLPKSAAPGKHDATPRDV